MPATPARAQTSAPDYESEIDARFLPSPDLWAAVEPLIPEPTGGGRPRKPDRQMFAAMFYVLRSGIQWKAIPRCLGAASTVHDRFQEWTLAGVFAELWATGLVEFDASVGLDWTWQSLDGCMTKAPLGGEATGPNPTDRGKQPGFNRSSQQLVSVVVAGHPPSLRRASASPASSAASC